MCAARSTAASNAQVPPELLEVVRRHWGFDSLRPMQAAAMRAFLAGQDSLLVLPTGGGKSLCYQAPALVREGLTLVVSPLIALMKDQVDGLRACGIPAVQLNSSLTSEERQDAEQALLDGTCQLAFASPERLATGGFRALLKRIGVQRFAIDEAHCISHWGHDFRPDYRLLGELKQLFPRASLHACTATATEQVRADIVAQLGLADPTVIVGNFDRPNLQYHVVPRSNEVEQALEVIDRHRGEAGIIYCLRRNDVDNLAKLLQRRKIKALPYHAGMDADERKRVHDRFTQERCDVVVATVAFGMGIDRSNIRYVLHMGMPKSIEHYQQETGRAGRDGLEAECILLYSPGDAMLWKKIVQKSIAESENPVDPDYLENVYQHLADMEHYCRPVTCRHRSLVEYFGQAYEGSNCGACDLCTGDSEPVPDAETIAKKILSCVYRVQESYGATHVAAVLRGANTAQIRNRGHHQVSTYGLLKEYSQQQLADWISQLIGQGLLVQAGHEYPVLKLNPASWEVLRDQREARLRATPGLKTVATSSGSRGTKRRAKVDMESWSGVDRELFERLRQLRQELATARGVPPYLIFGDATLRALARDRPSTVDGMAQVYGIGEAKFRDFAAPFFDVLESECQRRELSRDMAQEEAPAAARPAAEKAPAAGVVAAALFRDGQSLETVMQQTGRTRSTVAQYLNDFLLEEPQESVAPWVSEAVYGRVAAAAADLGLDKLKPIYESLNGEIPYDEIRIVVAHLKSHSTSDAEADDSESEE